MAVASDYGNATRQFREALQYFHNRMPIGMIPSKYMTVRGHVGNTHTWNLKVQIPASQRTPPPWPIPFDDEAIDFCVSRFNKSITNWHRRDGVVLDDIIIDSVIFYGTDYLPRELNPEYYEYIWPSAAAHPRFAK